MPFTPAHPAIVLPFLRIRKLSATGLIAGSLAPDFEYFFKFSVSSRVSHTGWAILYFNVPVTLLLAVIFHLLVKQNLIRNLPGFLQGRFQDTLMFDFKKYLRQNFWYFVLSAIIGSVSHVFWDGFTHGTGFFVNELPFYKDTVVPFDGARYPLFYALQHISTVVGLLAIIVYTLFKRNYPLNEPTNVSYGYWLFVVLITAAVVAIRFSIYSVDYQIGNLVVSAISGFCISLIAANFITFNKGSHV